MPSPDPGVPGAESTTRLHHGTTKHRAEAILKDGPDPGFREPGALTTEPAFFTARPEGPFSAGKPEDYARSKARIFSNEGGPAIVEVDVPDPIIAVALDLKAEVVFGPGYGLEDLLRAWPSLNKRVIVLE